MTLRILQTPELTDPIMLAAFAGWSDAGGAATGAVQYLVDRWHAARMADLEAEDFYDFTQLRPTVRWEGEERRIDWPDNAFYFHQVGGRDLIVFNGIEPHLHWKAYTRTIMEFVEQFQVKMVVSLGAMFVDYPHTRPMRVTGTAPDAGMMDRAGLFTRGGKYEGPTGINGVFNVLLREKERARRDDLGERAPLRLGLTEPAGLARAAQVPYGDARDGSAAGQDGARLRRLRPAAQRGDIAQLRSLRLRAPA